ncbi:MAG: LpqB family beta-propeller domain-containing protein [Streptosporangiaceae bacterium]
MSRSWLAAGAVALCAALASCASLPTSGSIRVSTLQGGGVQGQTGVQVVPAPPGRNWGPVDIVQGFLAASASFGKHHAVAREYLTRALARTWRPGWSATVVDVPTVNRYRFPGKPPVGVAPTAVVNLTGQHFATLQTAGQDQAGSVVVAPASTVFRFSLVQQAGQWRIEAISMNDKPVPPSLLLLARPDFERDYLARNIYFFPAGSPGSTLVPDPVYIPQTGLVAEVRGMVSALIQPPCPARKTTSSTGTCPTNPPSSSWLYGAAGTAFPRGVRTVEPVQVVGGVTAVVDLGNTAAKTSQTQRRRMASQLAWSLTESPYGPQAGGQISSVVLKFGHQSMTVSLKAKWVPRGLSSPLYYQVPGGPAQETQVTLRTGNSQPFNLTLPRRVGGRPFTAMAVSPAPLGAAVLAGCSGQTLYLIPQARARDVVTKRLPASCTSLSWDSGGNLWIAAGSGVLEIPGAGASAPASSALVQVQIPPLAQPNVKPVQVLKIAPDGVRAALIVPSGPGSKILIAAISSNSNFTYIAQTSPMLRVGSDLPHPIALSWLDPDHLLVLDRGASGRTEIYEVPLNGGASTEVSTPSGVTSLSAAWPDPAGLPRVVIGIAATGGAPARIEQSRGSLINPDWQPIGTGVTPVLPG